MILVTIIGGILLYYLNENILYFVIILVIFIILFLVIKFFTNISSITRMDYYKYYWSKYNKNYY
jgi:hypothetical protein